jgi:hypothetical protein
MDYKVEDKIKARLENRSIAPKSKSWDELEALLDDTVKEKNPKVFWITIRKVAAVLVVVLLYVTLLYVYSDKDASTIQVVAKDQLPIDDLTREFPNGKKVEQSDVKLSENIIGHKEVKQEITAVPTKQKTVENPPKELIDANREKVEISELNPPEKKSSTIVSNFKPKIDAQDIVNEEINRLLVNSVNPKLTSSIIMEVQKLDLAQILDEIDLNDPEKEATFRKKVVRKINTIYAQLSEKNIRKE